MRLRFKSDIPLRRELFVAESFQHPAKLHLNLLMWLVERYTKPGDTLADPMAGTGSLLLATMVQRHVILRDVEPLWINLCHKNASSIQARAGMFAGNADIGLHDARQPWKFQCDHILVSPPYACRISPNASSRRSIFQRRLQRLEQIGEYSERWQQLMSQHEASGAIGAELFHYGEADAQIGHLRGAAYWNAMKPIYLNSFEALAPGGLLIIIIKDHIRNFRRVCVVDETAAYCERIGFQLVARHQRVLDQMSLWTRRRRERGLEVVAEEEVLVLMR